MKDVRDVPLKLTINNIGRPTNNINILVCLLLWHASTTGLISMKFGTKLDGNLETVTRFKWKEMSNPMDNSWY